MDVTTVPKFMLDFYELTFVISLFRLYPAAQKL